MKRKMPTDTYPWHLRLFGIMLVFLFLNTTPLFAEKTDVVVLDNGDRITGEIIKLEKGTLEYQTDDMGWIYIDWLKIVKISSQNKFAVEIENGQRYIGPIQETSEPGKMIILTDEGLVTLDMLSVVKISPLESVFKERFKGYIDLGVNLEKANQLLNTILGTEVTYRTTKLEAKLAGQSYLGKQENVDEISRHNLSLSFTRLMKNRWRVTLMTMAYHNSELDLKLRATLGGALGRSLVQTNHMLLLLLGGVAATREQYMEEEEKQYNIEMLGGATFQAFRNDHPKLDSSFALSFWPSITDFGRIRVEVNSRVRYEIFRDYYVTLNGFYHFDSRPGTESVNDVSRHDYGIELTFSISFK